MVNAAQGDVPLGEPNPGVVDGGVGEPKPGAPGEPAGVPVPDGVMPALLSSAFRRASS